MKRFYKSFEIQTLRTSHKIKENEQLCMTHVEVLNYVWYQQGLHENRGEGALLSAEFLG